MAGVAVNEAHSLTSRENADDGHHCGRPTKARPAHIMPIMAPIARRSRASAHHADDGHHCQ
eukprot:5912716-Prorocentrum_lima.AAC.1